MASLRATADKAAIGLSMFCTIHCLLLPVLLVYIPTSATVLLGDEAFHRWMVIAVIPISALSLTLGCRKHKTAAVVITGVCGVAVLLLAALFAHDYLGGSGEKLFTVLGATVIAAAHLWNHRLCQHLENCNCTDPAKGHSIW